jgi:hypothetical protein
MEDKLEVVPPAWLRSGSSCCLEADAVEDELEVAPVGLGATSHYLLEGLAQPMPVLELPVPRSRVRELPASRCRRGGR